MNKLLKSTFTVVALTASCWGSWKTYQHYGIEHKEIDLLLAENLMALSENTNQQEVCIEEKNCYYKVQTSKTPVVDEKGKLLYYTVTYEQKVTPYQVCATVSEPTKYEKCDHRELVGIAGCVASHGQGKPIPEGELGTFNEE